MEFKSDREPLGVTSRSGDRSLLEREEPLARPEACFGLLLFGDGFLGGSADRVPREEEHATPGPGSDPFLAGATEGFRSGTGVEAAVGTKGAEVATTVDATDTGGNPSKERDIDESTPLSSTALDVETLAGAGVAKDSTSRKKDSVVTG